MTREDILQKKVHGDLKIAGDMIGITEKNAYAALNREGSKYHTEVIEALSEIIEMRETLQKNRKTAKYENA